MTQSLPTPGQDNGTWGTMLNNFLTVSLNADGTVASSVIADAQISSSAAINPTKISGTAEVQTNKGAASGYAPLNSSSLVPTTYLGTNTATSSNYLRGDGTWNSPPTASNATTSAPGLVQLAGDLGGVGTTASAPTLLGTTNVENIISANTTVAGALQATGNLATIGDSGSARANLHVPALTPAAAVAVSSISGTYSAGPPATFTTSVNSLDGYTPFVAGDIILFTAQGSGAGNSVANGPWLVPSPWTPGTTPLTRPTEFASGATVKGRSIVILNGTTNGNTMWVLDAPSAGLTIDSGSQTWINPLAQTGFLQYIKSNISPDELLPAAANTNLGGFRMTNVAAPLYDTDAAVALGSQIGYTSYLPTSSYSKTIGSTTGAAVDTTNLTVQFTAISTKVLVEIEAVVSFYTAPALGQSIGFTLYNHSTTTQQGYWAIAYTAPSTSTSVGARTHTYIEVDGLTQGTSYHWDLGWACSAGTALLQAEQTQSSTWANPGQAGGVYIRVYAQ